MSVDHERAQRMIREYNIEFIDLKTLDLVGRLHHITLPVRDNTLDLLCDQGVGFDGSNFGFAKVESSDMVQKPDLSTIQIDLFRDRPTLTCFTNVYATDAQRSRYSQDVRWIVQQAEELLRSLDIADETFWGPELEYYIFSGIEFDNQPASSYFKISHDEAFFENAYHACNPFDLYDDFRDESCRLLEQAGIPIKYHHHEVGERGQQEIEFLFEPLLKSCDSITLAKYILFNQAAEQGLELTFMPKPLYREAGSGLHVHQFFRKNGKNVFYKEGEYANLNETALFYVGGLLKHANALAAFTNPSTNSYKRLVPGYEAPVALTFSQANRSSCVRIPRYVYDPTETRIEYRPPDATANPYLMMASMLMAGIDGIVNKIDPRTEGYGPFDGNLNEKSDITFLPQSLSEALDALEKDNEFLQRGGVFPASIIDQWIRVKRQEARSIALMPHPYEFQMYFHR